MIFSIKDSLRQAVEAASGGKCTVMYTKKGMPVFMRRIPKFRLESLHSALGTGLHPAFIVGNREINEFWVSMYPVTLVSGELVSVPYQAPSGLTFTDAVAAARATGPGFHIITNAEWSAIALSVIHGLGNDDDPTSGPDVYGRDRSNPKLFGQRLDGRAPGDTSSTSFVFPGSGPLSWRHDNTVHGIDVVNLPMGWGYWVTGLMLRSGELRIIPNNDAALPDIDLSPASTAWKAIMPDGSLVSPGTNGSLKYTLPPGVTYQGTPSSRGATTLSTSWTAPPFDENSNLDFTDNLWKDIGKNPSTLTVPSILHTLLLFPHVPVSKGKMQVHPYGTCFPKRGLLGLTGLVLNKVDFSYIYLAYIV